MKAFKQRRKSHSEHSINISVYIYIYIYIYIHVCVCPCVCVGFPDGSEAKNLPAIQEMQMFVGSLDQEDPLEEEIATCSSIPAWRIPWTEEPSGLQSNGSRSLTWVSNWACTCVCVCVCARACNDLSEVRDYSTSVNKVQKEYLTWQ